MMDFQGCGRKQFWSNLMKTLQSRKLPGGTEEKVEVTIRGSCQTDQFPLPMNVTILRLRLSRKKCLNSETFSDLLQV
jgi:hypothetical protein